MDNAKVPPTRLVEHDGALDLLLDDLLAEATAPIVDRVAETPPLNSDVEAPITRPAAGDTHNDVVPTLCPPWALQPFRVLLFRVGGQRFAMPLVLLSSVALMPPRLHELPSGPDWELGIARLRDLSVVIADLGGLLGIATACEAPRYLLLVGEGRTAVACDQFEDAVLIETDQVRWPRGARVQPWLAGLLTCQMCVLIDPLVVEEKIRHG
ncbi:MAG: chemotaxis protein CheW [Gammaproteobacteria bacterium]|nr:chemotaxis protein CheW [Gammaproteobacteria bacterium]